MKLSNDMDELIEARFRALPWYGAVALEDAIRQMQEYRHGLTDEERGWFDEAITNGAHPSYAAQLVEGMSGREEQWTGRPAPSLKSGAVR